MLGGSLTWETTERGQTPVSGPAPGGWATGEGLTPVECGLLDAGCCFPPAISTPFLSHEPPSPRISLPARTSRRQNRRRERSMLHRTYA